MENKTEDVWGAVQRIIDLLPKTNDYRIWASGDEIFCENEQTAEAIADLIDAMYGDQVACTGYYDPKEDERSGEVDECTGFYYVNVV